MAAPANGESDGYLSDIERAAGGVDEGGTVRRASDVEPSAAAEEKMAKRVFSLSDGWVPDITQSCRQARRHT